MCKGREDVKIKITSTEKNKKARLWWKGRRDKKTSISSKDEKRHMNRQHKKGRYDTKGKRLQWHVRKDRKTGHVGQGKKEKCTCRLVSMAWTEKDRAEEAKKKR